MSASTSMRLVLFDVLLWSVVVLGSARVLGSALGQQKLPNHELKVGARNSVIRNIGSFQVDSALIFPKRQAKTDTLHSKALKKKGAFFYDSMTHVVWFFDGKYFRRADSNIYNSNGTLSEERTVSMDGKNLIFQNNNAQGQMILRNENHDNLPKIEAGSTTDKQGGIWLSEKHNKFGFKLVNNAGSDNFEVYLTNADKPDNSANATATKDTQVLAIHRNGLVQICGYGPSSNQSNSIYSESMPTLRFQRASNNHNKQNNNAKYWFIRFDDSRDRLYFGKQEPRCSGSCKCKDKGFRNRVAIAENVVVIGPKQCDHDFYLGKVKANDVRYRALTNTGFTNHINSRGTHYDAPALFVNGPTQATAFITGSDSALKRDIHSMQNALAQLLRLRPVTYYWRDSSEGVWL